MKYSRRIKEFQYIEHYRAQVNQSYAKLPNKVELTKEQVQEIQDFYRPLLGYEVPTDWHRYFYSRTGVFSKYFVPTGVYRLEVIGRLNNVRFSVPYSDKNMQDILLPEVNQPHIYLKNRNGYFFVDDKPVELEEAVRACADLGEVIIKPALTSHGDGVQKITIANARVEESGDSLEELFVKYRRNYLIQDVVRQHAGMAALNGSSVNTIRAVTYRSAAGVEVLYTVARIGREGKVIDNESAGGLSVRIEGNGTLARYAYGAPGQDKIEKTDSGIVMEGYQVPSYDKAMEMVREQHKLLPFHNVIGWDICIGKDGEPVLLEWNTAPELSQSAYGPAFGSNVERILNDAMRRQNTRNLKPISFNGAMNFFARKIVKGSLY